MAIVKITDSQVPLACHQISMIVNQWHQHYLLVDLRVVKSMIVTIDPTNFTQLSLNGLNSIIGRGVVVHAGRDDMGRVRVSH